MKFITIILLLASLYSGASAQWVQTSGPEGVNILTSAVAQSGLILSDNSGNYYRYNGTSWTKTGTFEQSGYIQVVDDILFTTREMSLWRSSDLGSTWLQLPLHGQITGNITTLYCAMNDTLFASTDAGITWQANDTLPMFVHYVTQSGSYLIATVFGFEKQLYRSLVGSKEWTPASVPPPMDGNTLITDIISDDNVLYALLSSGEVYSSSDNGDTWIKALSAPSDEPQQYSQLLKKGPVFWVRSYSGIHEWNDSSWSLRMSGYFVAMNIYDGGIVLSNNQGVYRLHKDQNTLELLSSGFKSATISAISVFGKTTFATTHAGVFRSTDLGTSWSQVNTGQPSDYASTGTYIFSFGAGQGFYRSSDNGITWESLSTPLDDQWKDGTSIAAHGTTLFLVHGTTFGEHGTNRWVDGGVLRSTDNGTTWKNSNSGLPSTVESYVPTQQIVNHNGTLYIATVEGFYHSTNSGSSWVPTNMGIEFQNNIKSGALIKGGNSIYAQYYGDIYQLVSDVWVKLPMPDSTVSYFGAYSGYAVGVGDSLYAIGYSYDNFTTTFIYKTYLFDGASWSDITSSLPEGVVLNNFTRTADIMLAGSMGHSVWRLGIPNAVTPGQTLSEVSLYPNPADDFINMDLTITDARITFTNILGNTVLKLTAVNGNEPINISSLPPGVYTVTIEAGDKISVARVIVE